MERFLSDAVRKALPVPAIAMVGTPLCPKSASSKFRRRIGWKS
jgi:hypothetical protein